MDNIVYVVERYGVYQQGIYGIFSTPAQAEQAKIRAKALEEDNYHSFNITKVQLNVEATLDKTFSGVKYLWTKL